MRRRTLITASFAVIGSVVAGCLETSDPMDDSGENTDPVDTATPDAGNGDGLRTEFTVLDSSHSGEESASITFGDGTVVATGTIRGNNGCYTARLGDVTMENDSLVVGIESFEDAEEDMGCTAATIYIEYEATVEISGDRPSSVRVDHNGEPVTTAQAS